MFPRRALASLMSTGLLATSALAHADPEPSRIAQIDVAPKVTPLPAPNTPKKNDTPPGESPPVPDPNLLVLGGTPQNPDFAVKPLFWNWRRFGTADYVVSASAGAITLAAAIMHPLPNHSLTGPVLFDRQIRNSVRPDESQTRYTFRDASDVGLSLAATWPFFIDSLMTAWWYRGSRDAAQEMALLNLETLAIAGALQGMTNVIVSRPRPYDVTCGTPELPTSSSDCQAPQHYRSFFSGHATFSFTTAALLCLDHEKNELLGEPWDAITCGGGYAAAAMTSAFRVVSDMHYSSDILTGALIGTMVGYGVPWLHYKRIDFGAHVGGVKMTLLPTANGAGVMGSF